MEGLQELGRESVKPGWHCDECDDVHCKGAPGQSESAQTSEPSGMRGFTPEEATRYRAALGKMATPKEPSESAKGEAKALREVLDADDAYIKVLEEECGEMAAFAFIHGIQSTRYEAGKQARERIAIARAALGSAPEREKE